MLWPFSRTALTKQFQWKEYMFFLESIKMISVLTIIKNNSYLKLKGTIYNFTFSTSQNQVTVPECWIRRAFEDNSEIRVLASPQKLTLWYLWRFLRCQNMFVEKRKLILELSNTQITINSAGVNFTTKVIYQ